MLRLYTVVYAIAVRVLLVCDGGYSYISVPIYGTKQNTTFTHNTLHCSTESNNRRTASVVTLRKVPLMVQLRVASLLPSATDTVVALGCASWIVARSHEVRVHWDVPNTHHIV